MSTKKKDICEILNRIRVLTQNKEHSRLYFDFHSKRFELTLLEVGRVLDSLKKKGFDKIQVVDVGSHELHTSLALKFLGCNVTGVDIKEFTEAEHIIALADEYEIDNLSYDTAGYGNIPLPNDCADLVLFCETIEHLDFHPLETVRDLVRVVKPGGFLLITTPNLLNIGMLQKFILRRSIHQDIAKPYTYGTHYRLYTVRELAYLMETAGLKVWRKSYLELPTSYLSGFSGAIRKLITGLVRPWSNNIIVIGKK